MVTLHHFTDPLWLGELKAWEKSSVVPLFEKFTVKVVKALKDYCSLWCTFNEPNGYALEGYVRGNYPPGKTDLKLGVQVQANMVRAHAAAYYAIHRLQPDARVGYALHFRPQVPSHSWSPLDRLMRSIRFTGINLAFPSAISTGTLVSPIGRMSIPEARGTQDYFGLNYYFVDTVAFDLRNRAELFSRSFFSKGTDVSDAGTNANIPEGFTWSIKWVVKAFPNVPILVTENGIEDGSDRIRPRYIAQHVHAMWRAVNFNLPVRGYFHWSLVDNFEWVYGWNQKFGLWGLNPETQERTKRPSADLFSEICRENGLSSSMVEKYCPEVYEKIFPG